VTLTLTDANSIVKAAIAKAQQLDIHVSVAVCDDHGRVIALNRMEGAFMEVDRFAVGKAIASTGTGLPSGEVVGFFHSRVDEVLGEGFPEYRVRGGLPILREGQIEGGCGVDGASSHAQEEECARAGIASLHLRSNQYQGKPEGDGK
jgi:uncharacterized protein GlcG (DUF336 family)